MDMDVDVDVDVGIDIDADITFYWSVEQLYTIFIISIACLLWTVLW
jgi:hypothetical protein